MEEKLITILSRNKYIEQIPFPLGEGRGEAPLGECHVEEELITILSRNKHKELLLSAKHVFVSNNTVIGERQAPS